jgi:hypothetical protein
LRAVARASRIEFAALELSATVEKSCLVSASLSTPIRLEPEIVVA